MIIPNCSIKFADINIELIKTAILRASKNHREKSEVKRVCNDLDKYSKKYLYDLKSGIWKRKLNYRDLVKVNPGNRKIRHIKTPNFYTRVYQHLLLEILEPIYNNYDNLNGLNCKPGCGITSKETGKSVIKKLKHIFYDKPELKYYLTIDQRKCYEHIKISVFRKMLKNLIQDKDLIDFATDVCFVDNTLPIGTPTSPIVHHIVMLTFDLFVKTLTPYSIRYADDNFLAFETKEEANAAKWRIMNFWWYELKIRAKRHTIVISPFTVPKDFCGFIFHRNTGKQVNDHNKGYVTIRRVIAKRAQKCKTNESWASYFGILQHGDCYKLIKTIEMESTKKGIDLRTLSETLKIDRGPWDAPSVTAEDLHNSKAIFVVRDFEIRYATEKIPGEKKPNYVKCLIYVLKDPVTKTVDVKVLQGNYPGICEFLINLDKEMLKINITKKDYLPIKNVTIAKRGGYVFENTTNCLNELTLSDDEFYDLFGTNS